MNNRIIILFSFISFLFCVDILETWHILQKDSIYIKYKYDKFPICSASISIDENINNVLAVVEDIKNYKIFFDSIIISEINDNDEVRLAIDMPFPFSNRDYTVKFSKIKDNLDINFLYHPVNSNFYPQDKDFIRLINAQGGWYINYIDSLHTDVKYIWNGEMLGNFPEWAYNKAWIKQGNEIMSNLYDEVKKRKNK